MKRPSLIGMRSLCGVLMVLPGAGRATAKVEVASILRDHMVLQQGMAAPVWGWADPGESVTVTFAGQKQTTKADGHGRWLVRLEPLAASAEGRELQVVGTNTVILRDVLVGEVWLCSGQSNMQFGLAGTINGAAEVAAAEYPQIRLFNVAEHTTAPLPQDRCGGGWRVCAPRGVGNFSAVGYFFGRRLHRELHVPVGLIDSSWGGTRIEPWVSQAGFRSLPELKQIADSVAVQDVSTPVGKAKWGEYLSAVDAWVVTARQALADGTPLPRQPEALVDAHIGAPCAIYNAMIHPLVPFAMRGAVWYQGESNGGEGVTYLLKTRALVNGWRQLFNPDLAFCSVQLSSFQKPTDDPAGGDGWARTREAQLRAAREIPGTGTVVIIDVGDVNDIHPRNKQDVGWRLAQWALHHCYGRTELVPGGPLFREQKVEGASMRLFFDNVGSGLMVGVKEGLAPTKAAPDGKLARFAIAGADRKWHWAEAVIDGQTVVVRHPDVPRPVAVRYAFSMNPTGCNLYNREGLPASPFRTDNW